MSLQCSKNVKLVIRWKHKITLFHINFKLNATKYLYNLVVFHGVFKCFKGRGHDRKYVSFEEIDI